ncbi:hypothetical protein O3P69_000849 [Scylla paramamosain]|uniref:Uncharacterized protein n=1 Tax=Scylla paramamosain TaxID=85552 RepID=A0AAW0USE2_SCYPA
MSYPGCRRGLKRSITTITITTGLPFQCGRMFINHTRRSPGWLGNMMGREVLYSSAEARAANVPRPHQLSTTGRAAKWYTGLGVSKTRMAARCGAAVAGVHVGPETAPRQAAEGSLRACL